MSSLVSTIAINGKFVAFGMQRCFVPLLTPNPVAFSFCEVNRAWLPESLSHHPLKMLPSARDTWRLYRGESSPQEVSRLEFATGVGRAVLSGMIPVAFALVYVPLPLNVGVDPFRGLTTRYTSSGRWTGGWMCLLQSLSYGPKPHDWAMWTVRASHNRLRSGIVELHVEGRILVGVTVMSDVPAWMQMSRPLEIKKGEVMLTIPREGALRLSIT